MELAIRENTNLDLAENDTYDSAVQITVNIDHLFA